MAEIKKLIVLRCCDGVEFEIEEEVAKVSKTIANMIEDGVTEGGIPLPNVKGKTMAKILEYAKKHTEFEKKGITDEDAELTNWNAKFVKVDQATLFFMILAANYLNIKSLLDLLCQTVADMIKGKSPEQIRKLLNIPNDFTPEEEEEVRKEHQWAFE